MDFRRISLIIAESVDAWRIIPRVILVLYGTLVFNLYLWYRSIPTYVQEQCEAGVLRVLMESGMDIEDARSIACSVIDIVGGPTAAQSAFVTTIIGLSTGIFGLYVATGRRWEGGLPSDVNKLPVYPNQPYPTNTPTYGPTPNTPQQPHYGPRSPQSGGPTQWPNQQPPKGPWGGGGG